MGRKSLRDAVLEKELARLQLEGLDFDEAWKVANEVEEERQTRYREKRRKDNARYQGQYRENVKCTSETPLKTVTLYLPETVLARLDKEAKEVQEVMHSTRPLAVWRSAVVIHLLGLLPDSQQSKEVDRAREKKISSSQMYIQQQREAGVPDNDIQMHIHSSGLHMSIEEVLNYQFQVLK